MLRFLTRPSPLVAVVESLLLLFAITWLDLATGHQVSLVLFYTAPIVFAVWLCDNRSPFIVAGLAGVLWSWADIALGHLYSSATVQVWEISIRFAFFFLVALAGIATKERHQASSARIKLLEHSRRLEQQIIEVSEYERQRIGRDLQEGGLEKLAATAGEIEKHLTESVKQARILAHGLVPVQFDEAGLPAALQELAASTSRLLAMDCTFAFAGEYRATHNDKATHLYRIAQEAINNATKHGKARNVEMRLSANSSAMSLSIADDGTGFSKTEKDRNGVGISIMRYRANVVGGEFEIEERPKGGTIVSCTVPAKA